MSAGRSTRFIPINFGEGSPRTIRGIVAVTADLTVPTFTKTRVLLRNSTFLLQVVVESKTKHNILRFKQHDFEFRNSPQNNVKVGQPPKSKIMKRRDR